jgi:hypothetical protein
MKRKEEQGWTKTSIIFFFTIENLINAWD